MRELGMWRLAVICVPILISGCAGGDLLSPSEPGKYDFLDRPSAAKSMRQMMAREQQLNELMSRANEGTGGFIVNAFVYGDDLNQTRANIRELRKAAEAKKCAIDPAATAR